MSEHIKFPKIPRVEKVEVIITEKLDGTNALIYIDDNGDMKFGSRNRWLTEDSDNHGFYTFCMKNKDMLARLGRGYHYGEFIGSGIARQYGFTNGERKLYMFDARLVDRELGDNIKVVPILKQATLHDMTGLFDLRDYINPSTTVRESTINKDTRMEGVMIFLTHLNKYIKVIYDKSGDRN